MKEDDDAASSSSNEGSVDPADALFDRTSFLRSLREADEAERAAAAEEGDGAISTKKGVTVLPNGQLLLAYDEYLTDQRYYDDLKHVDCHFIDFGPLIIEQDKSLGKGGLCWDAAFILGEYLIANYQCTGSTTTMNMIELGCGTGICGLMVARALASRVHMTVTDLPALQPLLQRNVARNFHGHVDGIIANYMSTRNYHFVQGECNVKASVLEWGDRQAEEKHGTFDIVFGADVVASLYDPVKLAHTIARLCQSQTVVYISFKERLSIMHRQFEAEMARLFRVTEIVQPVSRNRNPDVRILTAREKLHTLSLE
jgi:predicted nicotinamide N-methyase